MPSTPQDRRRRDWQREFIKAVDALLPRSTGAVPTLQPLDKLLQQMDALLDRNALDDPRVDWDVWVQGASSRTVQARDSGIRALSPLTVMLDVDAIPASYKQRALRIAARLEEACPEWADTFEEQRFYGNLPLVTWLRCADLPDAVAFFQQRHPDGRRGSTGQAWRAPQEEWSHALARWLVNPVTYERRSNDPRSVGPERRTELFNAAVANGWLSPDVLHSYQWSETARQKSPGALVVPASLNPLYSGALPEILACVERPGGLFDHWCRTTGGWSTWVSPSTQTSVWRSLLANHDPGLLLHALAADPDALNRPVPMGRWMRGLPSAQERQMPPAVSRMRSNDNIPGVAAESVRSYAGVSLGTQDLYEALNAHPQQKERLIGWWNDPAPTLRDTLELLVMHVLPVAGGNARGLNTGWADRVGPVVESLVLNEVLASPALPASRSRARL